MLNRLVRDNDEPRLEQSAHSEFRSSYVGLFLPTMIIALGYGALWFSLFLLDQSDGALGRLCLFVLLLAIPLLIAYGLLRYMTTSITLYNASAHVHAGFPSRDPVYIPYRFIEFVEVNYGLLGRLTKSASLKIGLTAKKTVEVAHIHEPERVKLAIELEIAKSAKKSLLTEFDKG